jgi:phosphatidylserine/phosphatidylglycerophosphate/cardiolipin synthase-like enzyme
MSEILPDSALARPADSHRIVVEGRSCWRVARADRIAVLIDGAAYFRALLDAFRLARERIMVLGWDFDPRVRLDPDDRNTELRRLLPALADARPELEIFVLIWDVAVVFGPSRTIAPLVDREWQSHPRIHLDFDGHHPPQASQHEKIVCVDDALAFVGGIDLTVGRWDSTRHAAADPRRVSPEGEPCPPVHDLQMLVDGDAARTVATLARRRWAQSRGRRLRPCNAGATAWPASAGVWLAGAEVGIARTRPRMDGRPAVDEIARLNDAALAAARHCVYIEAQYLCASAVADRLEELLRRQNGPQIVALVWRETTGWLERVAMGGNRDRVLRRLAAADRHARLRAYSLAAAGDPEREVKLHSKLVIIDDVFVRIGSSNLNNRSLGVDSECDLAIEAADATGSTAIARLRDTLLAEHLGCRLGEASRAVAEHGLIGAVERLNGPHGRLRPYRLDPAEGPTEPVVGTRFIDPDEPLDLEYLTRSLRDRLLPD